MVIPINAISCPKEFLYFEETYKPFDRPTAADADEKKVSKGYRFFLYSRKGTRRLCK